MCREFSPLLVPAKMTGVATPRLLAGPAAPGREVLPWLRKRRPFRKTRSCRVQSGGAGGAREAGRDEKRLGGSWMEARATLFWGDRGAPQRRPLAPSRRPPPPPDTAPLLATLALTAPHAHLDVEGGQGNVGPPGGAAEAQVPVSGELGLGQGAVTRAVQAWPGQPFLLPLEGCAGQTHVAVWLDEVGLQRHVP